jgi:hypothetical protein
MDWQQFLSQLEAFAGNRLPLAALRRRFTPLLSGARTPSPKDRDLIFSLIFLFEDESLSEQAHRQNALRLVKASHELEDLTVFAILIPLIIDQDRLCTIVERYRTKIISRTAFISAMSSVRYASRLKEWLAESDSASLESFCKALSNGEYHVATAMTQLK